MKKPVNFIGTNELLGHLGKKNTVIIDVRPSEAYNGWRLMNEPRGGHIRGARSLPCRWRKYIDWIEMVRGKGIFPENEIIIYGYSERQSIPVAERFICAGYGKVSLYLNFNEEWSADPALPMDQLPRYRQLVSARWLEKLLMEKTAPELKHHRFVLGHVHYQNYQDYMDGHIPGAVSMDTNLFESPDTWNRRKPEELHQVFQDLGITTDTTVVLYGRFSYPDTRDPFPGSSEGQLGAMRVASLMMWAGVEDVRVLNGGIGSWEDEGFRLSVNETKPSPVLSFGASIPQRPEYFIDIDEAKYYLASDEADLICVRSREEYNGEVSGYNYFDKKGHIPGVIFSNCGSDAYHMEEYRNLDHTCREYQEIRASWDAAGVDPRKRLAFYCGTGWRAGEAFFNAYLMAYPRISVYDGGWYEWSHDPSNPVEVENPGSSNNSSNQIINANNNI